MPNFLDDLDSRLNQLRLEPLDFMGSVAQKTVKDLSNTATISGYLDRLPSGMANAEAQHLPYFFMLDKSKLFMFASADDSECETSNLLILSSTTVSSVDEEGFAFTFEIKTLLDTWRLRAMSETQRDRWMTAITTAADPILFLQRNREEVVSSSLSRTDPTPTRELSTPISRTPTFGNSNNSNSSSNGRQQNSTLSRPGTPTTMSRSASRRIRPAKKLPSIPGPTLVDGSRSEVEIGSSSNNVASSNSRSTNSDGAGSQDFPGVHVDAQQQVVEVRDDAASVSSKVSMGTGGGWTLFRTRSKSDKKESVMAVVKDGDIDEGAPSAVNSPEATGLWRKKSFRQAFSLRARSHERLQQHASREDAALMASPASAGASSSASALAASPLRASSVGSLLGRAGVKAASGHLEVAVGPFVTAHVSPPPLTRRFVLIADSSIYVFASSQHSEQVLELFTLSPSSIVRPDPFPTFAFAFEVSDKSLDQTWMYGFLFFVELLKSPDEVISLKAPSKTAKATWLQTLNSYISANKSLNGSISANPSLTDGTDDVYDVLSSYEDEKDSNSVIATNLPLTPQQQKFLSKSKPVDPPPMAHSSSRGLYIPAPSMPSPILQNPVPARTIEQLQDSSPSRQQQYNWPVFVQQVAGPDFPGRPISVLSNHSVSAQNPSGRPVSILQQPLQNPLITQNPLSIGRSPSQQSSQSPIPARRSSDTNRPRRAIPMPSAGPVGRLSSSSASSSLASANVTLPPMSVLPSVTERNGNAVNNNSNGTTASGAETTSLLSGSGTSLASDVVSVTFPVSHGETSIAAAEAGQQELLLLQLQLERAKLELLDQMQMSKILLEAQKNGGSEGLVGTFTDSAIADSALSPQSSDSPMPSFAASEEKKAADSASIKSDKSKRSFTWFGRRRREGKLPPGADTTSKMAAAAAKMKRMDDLIADLDRSLSEFGQVDEDQADDADDGFDLLDSYNDDSDSVNAAAVGDERLRFQGATPAMLGPIPTDQRPPSNPIYRTAPQAVGVPMPSYPPVTRPVVNTQSTNLRDSPRAIPAATATTAAGYPPQLQQFQREYPARKNSLASAALSANSDRDSGLSFYGIATPSAAGGNAVAFTAPSQPPPAPVGPGLVMAPGVSVAGSFASVGDSIDADGEIRALRLEIERAKMELIDQMQMNKILLQSATASAAATPATIPDSVFRAASIPASSVGTPSQSQLPRASEEVESIKSDNKSEVRSESKSEKSGKSSATGWFGSRGKSVDKEAKAKRREEKRAIETKKKEVINVPMMM
ncbi:hypothetical protein HDU84_002838 [Entophlyctis sp. JEL0112]|nr:hypothetical protein HDU84_002838 [Entophlyctis sp. JEL0112]